MSKSTTFKVRAERLLKAIETLPRAIRIEVFRWLLEEVEICLQAAREDERE